MFCHNKTFRNVLSQQKQNFQEKVASAETQREKRQVSKTILKENEQSRVAGPAAAEENKNLICLSVDYKSFLKWGVLGVIDQSDVRGTFI